MNISTDYVSLIPPPNPKKEANKKAEKVDKPAKEAKFQNLEVKEVVRDLKLRLNPQL